MRVQMGRGFWPEPRGTGLWAPLFGGGVGLARAGALALAPGGGGRPQGGWWGSQVTPPGPRRVLVQRCSARDLISPVDLRYSVFLVLARPA